MPLYFIGVVVAFAEPVFHAGANVLDNYLSNGLFKRITPLLFLSAAVEVILLPVIWIASPPAFVSLQAGTILFIVALAEILYQYPYYWALREADTSVVTSLFSLGKIFVPFLAFLIVGERLGAWQYVGFFVIIIASSALTLDIRKLHINRAFMLMFLSSFILSVQLVLLKYAYDQGVGWGTSVVWMTLFEFAIMSAYMLIPQNRVALSGSLRNVHSVGSSFILMELFSWGGNLGSFFALYLIPVSIVQAIGSTQPLFVLLYALLFAQSFPAIFREYLDRKQLRKKLFLFFWIIAGTILIVWA